MEPLEFIQRQLIATRKYTREMLDMTPRDLWFVSPEGLETHIAWQVGHLAMAQFRLCIYFIRPVLDEDRVVISDDFMVHFRARTRPVADPAVYPPLDEILQIFHKVHEHILAGWWRYEAMNMNERVNRPSHRVVTTRLDALAWAARHEMIHVGQIGLLRRLLGCEPMW